MFFDHPSLGVGPGNYPARYVEYSQRIGLDPRPDARTPHNLYLETLAEVGLAGFLVFGFLLASAVAGAWHARRALPGKDALLAEGIFVAVVGFLINGIFLHGAYPRYLWLVIGLGLAAGALGRRATSSTAR